MSNQKLNLCLVPVSGKKLAPKDLETRAVEIQVSAFPVS